MQKGLKKPTLFFSIGSFLLAAFFAFVLFSARPAGASAGINQTMNFQGRLLNSQGATVPDGYYNIEFKIYQDGDGQSVGNTTGSPSGSLKWTEDWLNNNSQAVRVVNGYLSVQLGSITAFGSNIDWNQSTLWLSMNIGGTNATCHPFSSCSPDGEMVPMQPMTSAPYAFNSQALGGLTSSQFVQLAQGLQTDASTNNSIYINKTGGSGNIFDLQSGGSDVLVLGNGGDLTSKHTSTSAFQVQNASSKNVLSVDTSGNVVSLGNSGASGVTASLKFNYSGQTGSISFAPNNPSSTAYTINVPAENGTLCTTGSVCSGYANTALSNLSSIAINTSLLPASDNTIDIGDSSTHSFRTGYFDTSVLSASFDSQSSNGALGLGNTNAGAITLGNTANSTVTVKTKSSVTAFQIQDNNGTAIMTADSAKDRITLDTGNLVLTGITSPTPTLTSSGSGGTLAAGTYYYRLSVETPAGTSASGTVYPTAAVGSSPTSVTTTGSSSKNTLTWTTITGATGYYIYRSTDGGVTWYRNLVSGGGTTTAVDDGTNFTWSGTDYSYQAQTNGTGTIYVPKGSSVSFDGDGNGSIFEDALYNSLTLGAYDTSQRVEVQADSFSVRDTTGYNFNLLIDNTGATTFKNRVDSAAAFQIQNQNSKSLFKVDTTNSQIVLGQAGAGGVVGKLTFNNATNSNTVSIQSGTTSSSYTLTLPTALPGSTQCLQGDNTGVLSFVSCPTGSFLAKNATDTSTAAAGSGNLYAFTNSSSASTGSVLSLDNGTNTGSTFKATTSGNPGTGNAVILGTNTNSSPSGGLLDLQSGSSPASKFRIDASGNQEISTGYLNSAYGGLGSYSNLLTRSEQFDTSGTWTESNINAVGTDDYVAPDGNSTADSIQTTGSGTHSVTQTYTTSTNGNYTFSVWVRAASGTEPIQLRIDSTAATPTTGTAASFTATTAWQRFSVTQNFTGTPTNVKAVLLITNNTTTVVAWGGQLVTGTSSQVYIRTVGSNVAATDGLVNNGTAIFIPSSNSSTSFQVQNTTGKNVFVVDTTNGQVALGASGASGVTGAVKFNYSGQTGSVALDLNNPSSTNYTIHLPAENGTICTTAGSGACTAVYQAAGSYLAKNATDSSAANSGTGYLYSFTNSSSAAAGGVLGLDNGNNTGNGLYLTGSGNAGSGSAFILVSNTNAAPSGNLIDLQAGSSPTSKFKVDASGNIVLSGSISGGTSFSGSGDINTTGGAIKTNSTTRIDNSGNLTNIGNLGLSGTISGGTTVTGSGNFNSTGGAIQTNSTTRIDNSGNLTNIGNLGLTGTISGGTTVTGSGNFNSTSGSLQTNSTTRVDNSGNLTNIGNFTTTGASAFTATGANGFTFTNGTDNTGAFQVQNASAKNLFALDTSGNVVAFGDSSVGGITATLKFYRAGQTGSISVVTDNPSSTNYTIHLPAENGTICTTAGSGACTAVYQAAGSYLAKNAVDSSSAAAGGGYLLSLNNSSSAAAGGVLSLTNGTNTGNSLYINASGNPGSGSALIFASDTNAAPSGNLIDLQAGASPTSKFAVDASGNLVLTGSISGGTSFTGSGDINTTAGAFKLNGVSINTNGTLSNVAYLGQDQTFTGQNTFNRAGAGTGDYSLGITGTPVNNDTSSLIRIGNAIAGGNNSANGGTYIGLNAPNSGAGSAADFINIQKNSVVQLKLDNSGNVTLIGSISGGTSFTGSGNINSTAGAIQTNSTTRIDNSGNLTNIGTITAAGTINTTGGVIQTNSTTRIDNSGNLTNIGNLTTTGASTFTATGSNGFTFKPGTNNASTFQVQNTTSRNVLAVDTSATAVTVGNSTDGATFNIGAAAGSGTFTNNGSTKNITLALGDLAAGSIGTAANTVDKYTSFSIAPIASGRTYTIPAPTDAAVGRLIFISNIGGNTFTIGSTTFNSHSTGTLVYDGSGWNFAGMDGGSNNYIQNQTSTNQSASFKIAGTGYLNTDSATAFQVQNSSNRNILTLDSTAGLLTIGNTTEGAQITLGATGNANGVIRKTMVVNGSVNANDLVEIDTSNAGQTKQSAASSTKIFGVATSAVGSGNSQDIVIGGMYQVNANTSGGTPAVGDTLVSSSTVGQATKAGSTTSSGSVIGLAMSTISSGKIWVYINLGLGSNTNGIGRAVIITRLHRAEVRTTGLCVKCHFV